MNSNKLWLVEYARNWIFNISFFFLHLYWRILKRILLVLAGAILFITIYLCLLLVCAANWHTTNVRYMCNLDKEADKRLSFPLNHEISAKILIALEHNKNVDTARYTVVDNCKCLFRYTIVPCSLSAWQTRLATVDVGRQIERKLSFSLRLRKKSGFLKALSETAPTCCLHTFQIYIASLSSDWD